MNATAQINPLRKIITRPRPMFETLECGHTIPWYPGLGVYAQAPSKAKRRRCWKCGEGLPPDSAED